jgi:hypothetical protein
MIGTVAHVDLNNILGDLIVSHVGSQLILISMRSRNIPASLCWTGACLCRFP